MSALLNDLGKLVELLDEPGIPAVIDRRGDTVPRTLILWGGASEHRLLYRVLLITGAYHDVGPRFIEAWNKIADAQGFTGYTENIEVHYDEVPIGGKRHASWVELLVGGQRIDSRGVEADANS